RVAKAKRRQPRADSLELARRRERRERHMATWTGFARTAALCATLALAPGFLIATSHRADAGIFSWLGGRNQNNSDGYQQSAPNGGGLFGNRGGGGGIFQPAPR